VELKLESIPEQSYVFPLHTAHKHLEAGTEKQMAKWIERREYMGKLQHKAQGVRKLGKFM
jgi:hypothetical protein